MASLSHLFDNNRAWSERIRRIDPEFFARLSRQQRPRYLWIGCADSRVPANQIVGRLPGQRIGKRGHAAVNCNREIEWPCCRHRISDCHLEGPCA